MDVDFFGFRAFSWNVPQPRAGVYVFTNLHNRKCYVGESVNVADRVAGHSIGQSPRKFKNALGKYGNQGFLIESVWYASEIMTDKFYQLAVESEFILLFNSVVSGYNVLYNYHQGKYGQEWSDYLKTFWTAELRAKASEKTLQDFKDPARRALQSQATSEYLANNPEEAGRYFKEWYVNLTPEAKTEFLAKREPTRMAAVHKNNADPEFIERMVAATHTPEVNARRSQSQVEHWATPEGKAFLKARSENPEWIAKQSAAGKARFSTETARQQAREAQAKVAVQHAASLKSAWERNPRIWINDGVTAKHHFANLPIPDDWQRGRIGLYGRAAAKQRHLLSTQE